MELTALRYCVATAESGRVTAAAEQLHVAPSAVSRGIRNVEREIGVDLFDRVGRLVVPTRLGKAFLSEASAAIRTIDAAVRSVRERSGVTNGTVRLGFLTSLGASFVPAVLQQTGRTFPHLTIELAAGSERAVVEWLRAGEVDVAIGVPGMFDADGVSWDPLYEEELVCAAPSDHPLSRSTRVSLEQLSQSRLVLLSADFSVRRIVDAGFRAAGLAPTVVFEGPDVATLAGLIRAGIGIGILPSDVVTRESEDGRLVVMPIAGGLSRQIAVGRIARRLEEPAVAAVSALIRDAAHRGR